MTFFKQEQKVAKCFPQIQSDYIFTAKSVIIYFNKYECGKIEKQILEMMLILALISFRAVFLNVFTRKYT